MKYKRLFAFLFSLLFCLYAVPLLAAPPDMGRVEGHFMYADSIPLQGAAVLFFSNNLGPPQMPQGYDWLPDKAVPLNNEGYFTTAVPVGKYWYGVVKMPEDLTKSRPHLDEWLYVSSKQDGTQQRVEVRKDQISNMGETRVPANMFAGRQRSPVSVVSGRLQDQDKNPVVGLFVEAFANNEEGAKPVFISNLTTEKGIYSIRLLNGVFFLRVTPPDRFTRKGQPNKEFNKYVMPLPHRIIVGKRQDIPGVDITMQFR